MELLKNKLQKYKIKQTQSKSRLLPFQVFALKIIKDFKLVKTDEFDAPAVIWRYAKKNRAYVEGKVSLCVEKFGTKLDDKGHYLISLFRKKKPWE